MLYTGKGNRFIFWFLIPLIFISSFAFRIYEWQQVSDGNRALIAKEHSRNILQNKNINCLILGGSNALFGLSAEHLSSELNLNCYNLSLLNEGFSDSAYWDFVESAPLNNLLISQVFYSSINPIRTQNRFNERLKAEEAGIGINGKNSFNLIGKSIASYLKSFLLEGELGFNTHLYPVPNKWGDFVFESYEGCDNRKIKTSYTPTQDLVVLRSWGQEQLQQINLLFPNAQIYFVAPSFMRSKQFSETSYQSVLEVLKEVIDEKSNLIQKAAFIEQEPFMHLSFLCNAEHHANYAGRELRTNELIQIFRRMN